MNRHLSAAAVILVVSNLCCGQNAAIDKLLQRVSEHRITCLKAQHQLQKETRDKLWADPDTKRVLMNFCRNEAKPLTLSDQELDRLLQDRTKAVGKDTEATRSALKAMADSKKASPLDWAKRTCLKDVKGSLFAMDFDNEQTDKWMAGQIAGLDRPMLADNPVAQAKIRIYRAVIAWHKDNRALAEQCVKEVEGLVR